MTTELLTALQTFWSGNTNLTAISPVLYTARGLDATVTPFAVVDLLEGPAPQLNTGVRVLVTRPIVINVFGTDGAFVANAVDTIRQECDWLKLSLTNSQCIGFEYVADRTFAEDNKVFHGYVKYNVLMGEAFAR